MARWCARIRGEIRSGQISEVRAAAVRVLGLPPTSRPLPVHFDSQKADRNEAVIVAASRCKDGEAFFSQRARTWRRYDRDVDVIGGLVRSVLVANDALLDSRGKC